MAAEPLPSCLPADAASVARLAADPATLALIRFERAGAAAGAAPWIDSGIEWLAGPPVQAWQVATPVRHGRRRRFATHLTRGLAMLATAWPDSDDLETAARELYSELLATARSLGLPHFLYIWQYLPRVTAAWQGEERYRAFCAGRRRVLEASGAEDERLPAACLLGHDGDRIFLYALIARTPGRQLENPRQTSAFRYPPQYGRRPPSFSRAMAIGSRANERLLISGTSSITGHASRHAGTREQLAETIRNLEALVGHWQGRRARLEQIAPMKVYLRHREDLGRVRSALAARLPAGHPVTFLRADVCRPELNVEIEGIARRRIA